MRAKITKISTNENALRTNSMEGFFLEVPKINRAFKIFGDPLDPEMDARLVHTSLISKIDVEEGSNELTMLTMNSKYKLELYDDRKFINVDDELTVSDTKAL